ncbi:MAG: RHS repeat-associated core domain-containing protein, partial [Flavobacterium sp.]|nr:RHS repeat-associated core domain-containing protein [Flavobacterium sp.]
DYVFNYTDHLGNIRLSYGLDKSTNTVKIIEENHYYPFGLKHTNYNSDIYTYIKTSSGETGLKIIKPSPSIKVVPTYKYKYNGKEYQDELGLNMYDYGARNYDPALGRWMNIDPLAEKYNNVSPYAYAVNNPVFFIDPDGMQVDTDYKVLKNGNDKGKIVRVDPNDGSEKNEKDRILETDKNDNVKTETVKNSDGTKSKVNKVAINNIAKGIIEEGMNFRTNNYTIAFGGEGQPTRDDVVDFLVKFSEKIANAEIAGFEAIGASNKEQEYITTYKYEKNNFQTSLSPLYRYGQRVSSSYGTIIIMAHFHTHPNNTGIKDNINEPSEIDLDSQRIRNKPLKMNHYIYNVNGRIPY